MPGTNHDFLHLSGPYLNDGDIIFHGIGYDTSLEGGIYRLKSNGMIEPIVEARTPVPGTSNTLGTFAGIDIAGGNFAFSTSNSSRDRAVYTLIGGQLELVADETSAIPGGTGTFTSFTLPRFDGENVAFWGQGEGQQGVYSSNDGLTKVADTNTPVPGGSGPFVQFDFSRALSIENGKVVFVGSDMGKNGVFMEAGGALRIIADTSTMIPEGTGNFGIFMAPSLQGNTIAFSARASSDQSGIYRWRDGLLDVVADTNTPIPEGSGTFYRFGWFSSLDDNNVAFIGTDDTKRIGLYVEYAGVLQKILAEDDMLDGKVVEYLELVPRGLDGNRIGFHSYFRDGSEGLYFATIPEPATFLLIAGAWCLVARKKNT